MNSCENIHYFFKNFFCLIFKGNKYIFTLFLFICNCIFKYQFFLFSLFNKLFSNFKGLLRNSFSKIVSIIISYSLIYSQIFFSFILTQSVILSVSSIIPVHSAYADGAITTAPENVQHNPVDYIKVDNSVPVNNGDITTNGAGSGNGNNAYVDRAQNGTPMVNINNATESGVSVNYYKDFNVTKENLILNNYKGESVNTNLGGVIYGNPNFNVTDKNGNHVGREADIILNEITTNRQTNINGYIEVAGKKADVIIANPNGIMTSGAGFINTARLSMITGSSVNNGMGGTLDNKGNLNPFLLTDTETNPNAIITVTGKNVYNSNGNLVAYNLGIDAKNINYVDLISRIIKIDGNIIGSDNTEANFKTGNDKAYYNKDTNGNSNTNGFNVVSKDNTGDTNKPEFAIDSTAFGGVQAGRINFIATENGVGVRNRSDLIATVDDINFDVNGNINLETSEKASTTSSDTATTTATKTGSLYAKGNINLNTLVNTTVNPNKETDNTLNNRVILNTTSITAENNINVNTDYFINTNFNRSTDDNKAIYAKNNININTTKNFANIYSGFIQADNELNITSNNTIQNLNNSTLYANIINLITNTAIVNDENSIIYAKDTLTANANTIENNNSSTIYSNNNLTLNAALNLDNTLLGLIYSIYGNVNITTNNLNNSNTKTDSTTAKANSINYGIYTGTGNINFYVGNILNNNYGVINSKNNINIYGLIITLLDVTTGINLSIITNTSRVNNEQGQIKAGNNLTIKTNYLDNSNTNDTTNSGGILYANGNIDLINLNNNDGTIESNGNITISNTSATASTGLNTLYNTNGKILSINSSSLINILSTNSIINLNGNISSNGDITINVLADYIINGTIYSNADINITALNITNNSDVLAGNNIIINSTGNIGNGSSTNTTASIIAINNLIFNIFRDTRDGTDS